MSPIGNSSQITYTGESMNNMMPVAVSAASFVSIDSWKQERDFWLKATGQIGKRFNQFVRNSIRFFYENGNHNVVIVNGLLLIAHQSTMMNKQRLAAYLQACIPHELKDAGSKTKVPSFGKKIEGAQYDFPAVVEFLSKHLEWNSYGKEPTPAQFSLEIVATNAAKAAVKNNINMTEFLEKMQEKYLAAASTAAAKRAAKASK